MGARLVTMLLASAAFWQAGCGSAAVPREIVGDYQRLHTVHYFDGEEWLDLEGEDRLLLRDAGGGKLAFSVETVADNGHSCEMTGVAVSRPDGFEYRETLHLLPDEEPVECVLRLKTDSQKVVLEDVDHNCRLYYCGVRAKLNGLEFGRVPPNSGMADSWSRRLQAAKSA